MKSEMIEFGQAFLQDSTGIDYFDSKKSGNLIFMSAAFFWLTFFNKKSRMQKLKFENLNPLNSRLDYVDASQGKDRRLNGAHGWV